MDFYKNKNNWECFVASFNHVSINFFDENNDGWIERQCDIFFWGRSESCFLLRPCEFVNLVLSRPCKLLHNLTFSSLLFHFWLKKKRYSQSKSNLSPLVYSISLPSYDVFYTRNYNYTYLCCNVRNPRMSFFFQLHSNNYIKYMYMCIFEKFIWYFIN